MSRHAAIVGTGSYVPDRLVSDADPEASLGQPLDAWLRANVGIIERRVMAGEQITSDLCVPAARRALERARTSPEELDLIIVASDTLFDAVRSARP